MIKKAKRANAKTHGFFSKAVVFPGSRKLRTLVKLFYETCPNLRGNNIATIEMLSMKIILLREQIAYKDKTDLNADQFNASVGNIIKLGNSIDRCLRDNHLTAEAYATVKNKVGHSIWDEDSDILDDYKDD